MLISPARKLCYDIASLDGLRLITYGFLLLFSVVLLRMVYNACIHPLSSFKGPFWARSTPFYFTYLFAKKRSHLQTRELHQEYGSVVRLGPNLLSFDDPALLPEVYHRNVEKTPFYSTGLAGEKPPLLQIQSHDAHKEQMKALAPSYSMHNLKLLEDEVEERVHMVISTLRERHCRRNKPADLSEWTRWYVYDTITHLIYGHPVGFVEKGADVDNLIGSWHNMFLLGGLVSTLPWLVHPLITSWPLKKFIMPHKGLPYGSGAIMEAHGKFFQHRLDNPQLAHPGNIFDSFLRMSEKNKGRSLADAERECFLLTVAAQDTTAGFISPLISLIATNARVLKALRDEILAFENAGRLSNPVARYDEIAEMPYFEACVREALRLQPPTPLILPRYVGKGGMVIDGKEIPEGTEIGANPWVIHRDRGIFGDDVDDFRPERWLEDEERVKQMNKYDFTWGYGSRKCVGKYIAMMDGKKFVLQLFREFDISAMNPDKPWRSENWGINVYFDQWVHLHERHSSS